MLDNSPMPEDQWQTKDLPDAFDYLAPDGSEIRHFFPSNAVHRRGRASVLDRDAPEVARPGGSGVGRRPLAVTRADGPVMGA
jgi:hypothetical protein